MIKLMLLKLMSFHFINSVNQNEFKKKKGDLKNHPFNYN